MINNAIITNQSFIHLQENNEFLDGNVFWRHKYLSAMQSNGQHKDDRHNDRCDVKRHQRIRPQVPAGEHRGVGQLYQQDVDGAHSA